MRNGREEKMNMPMFGTQLISRAMNKFDYNMKEISELTRFLNKSKNKIILPQIKEE